MTPRLTRSFDRRLSLMIVMLGVGLSATGCSDADRNLARLDGTRPSISEMERQVEAIMRDARLPGLQIAVVNDNRVVYTRGFGVRSTARPDRVDPRTVFAAMSFSKTMFAYIVMRLVDSGVIDLDRPLTSYLSKPLPEYEAYADLAGDRRHERITARSVLSHTTGLPNWRWMSPDRKLRFIFEPGQRFSYSGEGFALLQAVVEEVTGVDLETLARAHIFSPLGLERTSYIFRDEFADNFAVDHDRYLHPIGKNRRHEAGAAGSAQTTAADFARFLAAVMRGDGLSRAIHQEMFSPQVRIRHVRMFGPLSSRALEPGQGGEVSWGLGWGLVESDHGRAIFHTGNDIGAANYHVAYPDRGLAVVLLGNSQTLESAAPALTELLIGDHASPFGFLGYEPYDSPRHRFVETIAARGWTAGLEYYEGLPDTGVGLWFVDDVDCLDRAGQDLLGLERFAAAEDLYRWTLHRYPDRIELFDHLASAQLARDDLEGARSTFARALSSAPTESDNARRLRWKLSWIDALIGPAEVSRDLLAEYAGRYELRRIELRDGALHYFRDNTGATEYRRLYAVSQDTFVMRELDTFRLQFARDSHGGVDRVVGHYIDGHTDVSLRDPG